MTIKMKTIVRNIIGVVFSNFTTIFSGIIVGFVIPKILSVEDFGYYKTFTLYATYIGFVSLGLIDGIVLEYGGYSYKELDAKKFRSYFFWYSMIHIFFTIVLFIVAFMIPQYEYRYVFLFIGLNIIPINYSGYFQQLSQITQRFREYSTRKILQSIVVIITVLLLYLSYSQGKEVRFTTYLSFLLATNYILTGWYIYTYRDLVFGNPFKSYVKIDEVFILIKKGFPLLFANLCSTLILTLDRQFVNLLFDNTTYAIYAFAYSLLSLVTVATSAISIVLYPTLKRTSEKSLKTNYSILITVVLSFVFLALALYFPLNIFVNWYLPKYSESILIFRIIFPGIAISSAISIVMHNYYKTLGVNFKYFKKSIVVLIASIFANYAAFYIWKTPASISIASIIMLIFWYIYVEQYFVNFYKYNRGKNLTYLVLMMIVFYITSGFTSNKYSLLSYIIIYLLATSAFYKEEFNKIVKHKYLGK